MKPFHPTVCSLTPCEIISELDRHIVGQAAAKRALALVLRERWRRLQLPLALQDEISTKNLLLIGPTGVGKTEIARRFARLAQAPFLKVEVTRFTEIGSIGQSVSQIVSDLMEVAMSMVEQSHRHGALAEANRQAKLQLVNFLEKTHGPSETLLTRLDSGALDEEPVVLFFNEGRIVPQTSGRWTCARSMTVQEALEFLAFEAQETLLDKAHMAKEAVRWVEATGIVFLDELDKLCAPSGLGERLVPTNSREGVQRDLLPLVEGTTVMTPYGPVRTDHIVFFAAGSFQNAKPSDLIPELQGRFPIRVELHPLTTENLTHILMATENNLISQQQALLSAENVTLEITKDGIQAIAILASELNDNVENIGARRLHTVLETILESISFEAAKNQGAHYVINSAMIRKTVRCLAQDRDLSNFML